MALSKDQCRGLIAPGSIGRSHTLLSHKSCNFHLRGTLWYLYCYLASKTLSSSLRHGSLAERNPASLKASFYKHLWTSFMKPNLKPYILQKRTANKRKLCQIKVDFANQDDAIKLWWCFDPFQGAGLSRRRCQLYSSIWILVLHWVANDRHCWRRHQDCLQDA